MLFYFRACSLEDYIPVPEYECIKNFALVSFRGLIEVVKIYCVAQSRFFWSASPGISVFLETSGPEYDFGLRVVG